MRKKIMARWIVGIFIGLFMVNCLIEIWGCAFQPRIDYEGFKARIDQTLPRLMKKYQVPGVALAVIRNERADVVKGYGWADVKSKRAVDENTLFQLASNSKTVAVWGVMKLVEAGKLELDAPVESYLTRWKLPQTKYDNNRVTLRRLLSHTAGLSQKSYPGYPPDEKLPTLEQSLSGQVKGTKELHLIKNPGAKYRYSGGGYTLTQLIIEEVTHEPFAKYMEAEVLKPLGMENSSYEWKPELRDKTSVAYGALGNPLPNYLFTEEAAAGLYSNVTDFARFVVANLKTFRSGEGIISKQSLALMYTPRKKDYGLGYIIDKLPDHTRLIYHGGTNRGWRSQFALLPERGDGLVVLTNSEYGGNLHSDLVAIWTKWETGHIPDFYLKAIALRSLVETVAVFGLLLLLVFIWKTTREVIQKRRILIFLAKISSGTMIRKVLFNGLLSIFGIIIWLVAFYTGLIYNGWTLASFVPWGFNWVTITMICWALFFVIWGLLPKADPARGVGCPNEGIKVKN